MELQVSTDAVAERDRFAFWHELMFTRFAFTPEAEPQTRQAFRGSFTLNVKGPLRYATIMSDPFLAVRGRREIAFRSWDGYRLYFEASARAVHQIAGREFVTATGDLLIDDPDVGFESVPKEGVHLEAWLIPRAIIEPHLPSRARPAMRLPQDSGIASLAGSFLAALRQNWGGVRAAEMPAIADTLARLIGIACGAAETEHEAAVRRGRLAQAKAHVNQHLGDPELTPARVAAALRISVRALHLLFEPTGTSFARYVLRGRLEACRAALLAEPTRPVIDIAFAWGFGALSGFYRAFQAAYGHSPGELRAAARPRGRSSALG